MLNLEKHRQILFNLIKDIYQSSAGPFLGFKGGTMFYFFHQLDRFSVDLDFDLLDEQEEGSVYAKIKQILQKYGVIKDEQNKEKTIFFLLSYGEAEHNVKVEISKRFLVINHYQVKNFYGTDVQVLSLEDALAHKLVACTQRQRVANRDYYDIFFFLKKNVGFNSEIVRARTGYDELEFLKKLRNQLANQNSRRGMLEGLGELLDDEKKSWVRSDLKKELLGLLDFIIDQKQRKV